MDHGHEMLTCSFCGRGQHETRKLVAGPLLYICDVCIAQGSEIARGSDTPSRGLFKVESEGTRNEPLHCNFCGKRHDQAALMLTSPTRAFSICDECLGLCSGILAEDAAMP